MTTAFTRLREFLDQKMRMSHVYQPVMLEALLSRDGSPRIRDIAAAILSHDESQLTTTRRSSRMPGKVLATHGIAQREKDTYRLHEEVARLSEDERADLIARCRQELEEFKAKRGKTIWEHRAPGLGIVPGKVRYETLKSASFRCELCGSSADERALDVDHIVPKSVGGTDDPENLQTLCWLCNTNKGAGDDVDFQGIRESYALREAGCAFCELGARELIAENPLAFLLADGFPVTEGHLLAIPRRHVSDYFDLRQPERNAIQRLLEEGRKIVRERHSEVAGFNVGINSGEAAGQTIFHCHVHLIPRRVGDVENPRGGVRGVIPERRDYSVADQSSRAK